MWPFRKSVPRLGDGAWAVARGEYDGRAMFVRVNETARVLFQAELPIRLGLACPLNEPDERGLPRGTEFTELNVIEDRINEAMKSTLAGRLVLIITTAGMREFVGYVRSAESGEEVADLVRRTTSSHQVQHYTTSDAEWTVFREFAAYL